MARDELRVAWREGLFLRPQHFQQQERYFDALARSHTGAVRPYPYGIVVGEVNESLAALGKFALERGSGLLPDGTPFSFPGDQTPPEPLDISSDTRDATVYLTLQSRIPGAPDFIDREKARPDVRHLVSEQTVHDNFSLERSEEAIEVAELNLNYGITREQTDGRICLPVARIQEVVNGTIQFDKRHIPPLLDVQASPRLTGFVNDVLGRLDQRLDELAMRAVEATEGGAETFANFLMLQVLNRTRPVLQHLRSLPMVHPERLYETFVSLACELTTFTRPERRAPVFPHYDHDNLQLTFEPVFESLQASLSAMFERSAGQIPLEGVGPGAYTARIADHSLLQTCAFYLAVSSRVQTEMLRSRFPSVVKIGTVQKMREIVGSSLQTGVRIAATVNPPPQLRILPGYVYFELDRSSRDWQDLLNAPALGIHVAGEWPDLNLELWWVKRSAR